MSANDSETGKQKPDQTLDPWTRSWGIGACIAAAFVLLLGSLLLASQASIARNDPLKSARLKEYRTKLQSAPTDEKLKATIREFDLQLRSLYFRHLSRQKSGVYLLLGGAIVFVLCAVQLNRRTRRLPLPLAIGSAKQEDKFRRNARFGRQAVAVTGGAFALFLLVTSLTLATIIPRRATDLERLLPTATDTTAANSTSAELFERNWPRFRGADSSGFSRLANPPEKWDTRSGEGLAWKIPVPAAGFNSPIVWNERIYFSGATRGECSVFCIEFNTGKSLWQQTLPRLNQPGDQKPSAATDESLATATMATDGERVLAFFGNGQLACFTLDGNALWSKSLGPLQNQYGHAASLVIWRDRLFLQLDQGQPEDNKSKLYAVDCRNGQVLWQQPRRTGSSWATPVVIEAAGKAQVITLAVPHVMAYSATDGTELWRVEALNGEITPSPIFAAGLIFAPNPADRLLAIRPDGSGNVSRTHVAWTNEDNVPDITSPVSNDEFLFTVTSSGILTCLDAKSGKKLWEHDFEMEFHSSPALAENRLYLVGQKGAVIIAHADKEFRELFRTQMEDEFHASPAFFRNSMILKGSTNLWCIGATAERLVNK